MKKYSVIVAIFLSLVLVLTGCGSKDVSTGDSSSDAKAPSNQEEQGSESKESNEPALAKEQTLIYGSDSEPAGLDPHKVPAHASVRIYTKIYDSLVKTDKDMNYVPNLAESWETPDDTTYIFNLRKNVKFHNGRQMTADDVKYSFERILNPDTASIAKSYFEKIKEINVIDESTIEFKLSEPYAPFMSYMSSSYAAVVPKEVVEENGDLMQVACGTGPFMLAEWVPDNSITLKKNPDYFMEGQPKLDSLVYNVMVDESSRVAALRTGAIHVTTLSPQTLPLLKKNEEVVIKSYQSNNYTFLGFNLNVEPFNNPKVRRAMSLAVDRDEMAKTIFSGDAVVTGPVPTALGKWSIDPTQNELYKQDIEEAKKLLAEAGYPDGFEMKITALGGYADIVGTAQVLQQQLEKIGIKSEIEQLEIGQYVAAWKKCDHQVMAGRNGAGSDPDRALGFFFNSSGSANVWGFKDDTYDELTNKGKVTIDEGERVKIYKEAQERLIELSPNLFFNSPMNYYFVRKEVENFDPTVFNPEDFRDTVILEVK